MTDRQSGTGGAGPGGEEPPLPLRMMPKGRYRGFSMIGRGGMGVVYLATDEDLHRPVALKVLRPDAGGIPESPLDVTPPEPETPDASSFGRLSFRLLQEAWITGALEHPGIVPVHEVGRTPAGVPYYTMRFIRGERTLRDAIDDAADLTERLGLLEPFLRVCDTVAFAHAHGVVHRDLKPSNVALGEYGEVVVLDWGVAKVVGEPDGGEDPWQDQIRAQREAREFRTSAALMGTVGYMAPEAAMGNPERIDERSDVYSLGAILFRILTRRLPFSFRDAREFLERLLGGTPPAARDLDPAVPAMLSGIAARALARGPEERFSSVRELAEAIRSWQRQSALDREIETLLAEARSTLESQEEVAGAARLPLLDRVNALAARALALSPGQPDAAELIERARAAREVSIRGRERAARRRALRIGAVLLLLLAAVASVGVAGVLERRRRDAERARAQAEDLASFMLFDLNDRLEEVGRLDILEEVARKASAYYRDLPKEGQTATVLRRRAIALLRAGEVLRLQGDLPGAMSAHREALRLTKDLYERDPASSRACRDYALATLRVGGLHLREGSLDSALHEFQAACAMLQKLKADDEDGRAELATGLARVAQVLDLRGDAKGARARLEEALSIRRALAKRPGADRGIRMDYASSLEEVGRAALIAGDRSKALDCSREALEVRKAIAAAAPGDVPVRRELAMGYIAMGDVQSEGDDPGASLQSYRSALEIERRIAREDPENTSRQRDLSIALNRVSNALRDGGDPRAALDPCREALAIRQRLAAKDPGNARWKRDLGSSFDHEGLLLQSLKDEKGALDRFRRAAEIRRALVKQDGRNKEWIRDLAFTLRSESEVEEALGDLAAAVKSMEEAVSVHERVAPLLARYADDQRAFEARLASLKGAREPR